MDRIVSIDPFEEAQTSFVQDEGFNDDTIIHPRPQLSELSGGPSAGLSLDALQEQINSIAQKKLTRFDSALHDMSGLKETEDEIWVRRVQLCMSKMAMLDPTRRSHKANLYRYFHIWSLCLPLNQKCDELGKQLKERNVALGNIRDSYHRDVIKVKFQLENMYDQQDNASKRGELASVPSIDLRGMVRDTYHQPNGAEPSNQFQDLFVNAATIKYTTADKMPWEYGSSFKDQKLNETGYEYKLPTVSASIMDLHAPSKHKLLVSYCSKCVGLMTLVHDWNKAVEEGLTANVDNLQAKGLRELVRNLSDISSKQEQEIYELTNKLALAQPKISFIEKRLNKEDDMDKIHHLSEKVNQWRFIAEMCNAERDTVEGNVRTTFNAKLHRAHEEYDILLANLNNKREECAYLTSEVEKMTDVFSQHEVRVIEHKAEQAKLLTKIRKQDEELERCLRSRDQVVKGIEEKDLYILELKSEHLERVENLNNTISVKNSQNERLANDVEKITTQLKEVTMTAMTARNKYLNDTASVVEGRLAVQAERDVLVMEYEDLRSAYHRDYLIGLERGSDRRRKGSKRGSDDDASLASKASDNEAKKQEIKRSLMLFPTKMRNSMASAIESVVSLNRQKAGGGSSRRFSSAGSLSNRSNSSSRKSSKNLLAVPVVVPSMIVENDDGDDMSSVGFSDDDDRTHASAVSGAVRNARVTTVRGIKQNTPAVTPATSDVDFVDDIDTAIVTTALDTSTNTHIADISPTVNNLDDDCESLSEDISEGEQLEREAELLDNIHQGMSQLAETILPSLSSNQLYDRPYKMKIVGIAIRFLLRLKKGLIHKDYSVMGSYGLKLFVKKLQKSMVIEISSTELNNLKDQMLAAQQEVSELTGALAAVKAEHIVEINGLQQSIIKLNGTVDNVNKLSIRERMISRMQRSHAVVLATSISVFRARLHLMTHANSILEEKPANMIPPPKKKPITTTTTATPPVKKKRLTMSFGSKAYAEDKKAKDAAMWSDEEEFNDITQVPLYKVRNVFFHVLARLRKLKFDRPFRRANSMLLTAHHGKSLPLWMAREEDIVSNFVKDAQVELGEVERIMKRMRHQCAEDRRKAEAFRALLGVDTALSVGVSFVGEPMISATTVTARKASVSGIKLAPTTTIVADNYDIITPLDDVSDVNKPNQYMGLDKNALRVLSSFRHRELRPELDIFSTTTNVATTTTATNVTTIARSRPTIMMKRTQSTAGGGSISISNDNSGNTSGKIPIITHAHTVMTGDDGGSSSRDVAPATLSQSIEQHRQNKITLRQRLRRNAVSGPAGVRPDDRHNADIKHSSDIGRAAATEQRMEKRLEKLTVRVNEVEDDLSDKSAEAARLQAELDIMIEDHEFLRKQNGALKQAISDSYRVCYEKTTEEVRKMGLDKQFFQQQNMRDISTQVACVPCDLATHNPQLGPHVHTNTKLRHVLMGKGNDSATALLLGPHMQDRDASEVLLNESMGPHYIEYQPFVTQKQNMAIGASATLGTDATMISSNNRHSSRNNVDTSNSHGSKSNNNSNTIASNIYGSSDNGMVRQSKQRPQSAMQLTTATAPSTAAPIPITPNAMMYNMDTVSLDVNTTTSIKHMHRNIHNASTDIYTDSVRVSPTSEYIQYLNNGDGINVSGGSRPASTFSKMKSIPRQGQGVVGGNSSGSGGRGSGGRYRTLSASASGPVGSEGGGSIRTRPGSAGGNIHVRIDLNKGHMTTTTTTTTTTENATHTSGGDGMPVGVQGGAIAHMASALQVLHEVRENQVAQVDIDKRYHSSNGGNNNTQKYKTDDDRKGVTPTATTVALGVSGVSHHGGGIVPRPSSARSPILLSSAVTPNSIPRLDKDRRVLNQLDADMGIDMYNDDDSYC